MASLREKKEEMVKEWEKCFERKFDEVCNKEGLNYLYDDNTSEEDALDMLDFFAKTVFVTDLIEKADSISIITVKDGTIVDKPETCEDCNFDNKPCKCDECENNKLRVVFRVVRKGKEILENKFRTEKEAEDFIKEHCLTSTDTRADFKIMQEI